MDGPPSVAVVLCAGGETEVGFSIVKAVEIYVVNHKTVRDIYYLAVHTNRASPCVLSDVGVAFGVKGAAIFRGKPFGPAEPIVIVGVNDGEFALRQWYAAKGAAIAEPAIEKDEEQNRLFDLTRDVKSNLQV